MTKLSISTSPILKNDRFLDWFVVPFSLLFIILAGYYGLFFDQTFFVDEDVVINFFHHEQNKNTNGWRPDVGLGLTYFFSDPSLSFSWGLVRWWNELFDDGIFAFQSLSMILIWIACIVQYHFIRIAVPNLGKLATVLISALIAFSPLRYEFLFLRSNTVQFIATPLFSFILYDFLKQPRLRHFFYYTGVIFTLSFLGSSISLFQMFVYIAIFCFAFAFYNKWHKNLSDFWKAFKRVLILNFVAGFTLFALGGWYFYAAFIEGSDLGYVRDREYADSNFFEPRSFVRTFFYLLKYLHAGLFPFDSVMLGIMQNINPISWNNFSPLFPFIFVIVLFWKSRNFWEYASKFIVLISFLFHEILNWFPGLLSFAQKVFSFYPPGKLYPSIHVYQILMFAILLDRLQDGSFKLNLKGIRIVRGLSIFLAPVYAGLFMVAVLTAFVPNQFENFLLRLYNNFYSGGSSLIPILIKENILMFNEKMGWLSILFYGSTFLILFWIAIKIGRKKPHLLKTPVIIATVLLNCVFLCWAIYPLQKDPMIWDRQKVDGDLLASKLQATDRVSRVGSPFCRGNPNYEECITKKFFGGDFGAYRNLIGYRNYPALEFSSTRSFTPKHVADFIKSFMALENRNNLSILRYLEDDPPIFDSRLYNISAVNYLLSRYILPEVDHLELVYENKQFYLYQNKNAWPYFYLADRIETIGTYEDLYDAEKRVAYLWKEDEKIVLPPKSPAKIRNLELVKFNYGDVEFKYKSGEEEFLVMADSWHPNWYAFVNGKETPILKTNGVFKGVLLPPGDGTVHLFFDNSPYRPGIWISAVAWSLFLAGWGWCRFRLREKW
jgi:hypothetical protein